ncbi:MAG: ABC transporter substrate-binding protein [Desulfobacterales bacterium]
MKKALVAVVMILVELSSFAYAEQPLDTLQKLIDQGITILNDPIYKDTAQKDNQRQQLSEILNQIVDFKEFCRRALASSLLKFTPEQLNEFTKLFARFVTVYYLSMLQDNYTNEKVILTRQNLISPSKAVVQATVFWNNVEIPVQIKMVRRGDSWKAYDIFGLGISVVRFYGAQFQEILRKETPDQIINRLKLKIRKIENNLQG